MSFEFKVSSRDAKGVIAVIESDPNQHTLATIANLGLAPRITIRFLYMVRFPLNAYNNQSGLVTQALHHLTDGTQGVGRPGTHHDR